MKSRAAKGAMWIAAEMGSLQFVSLLIFAILARFVSPKDFGLINISFLFLQSIKAVIFDGFASAVTRSADPTKAQYNTAFWLTTILAFISSGILLACSGFAGRVLGVAGLPAVLQPMSLVLLCMGIGRTHECWMIRNFHFRELAIRGVIGAVCGGVVGLVFAFKGFGIWALVAQQIVSYLTALSLLWKFTPWRPAMQFSLLEARAILRYVLQTVPGSVISMINLNLDTALVAYLFGAYSVGIYGAAKRLKLAPQMAISGPISGISLPILADAQSDAVLLRQTLIKAVTVTAIAATPIFLGISSVSPEIVAVFLGPKWAAAAPSLTYLSIAGLAAVLLGFNDTIFSIKGRPIISFYINAIYTICVVVCFFLLRISINTISIPFLIPYLIIGPVSVAIAGNLIGAGRWEWYRAVLPSLISGLLMAVSVSLTREAVATEPLLRLFLLSLTGALVYTLSSMILEYRILLSLFAPFFAKIVGKPPLLIQFLETAITRSVCAYRRFIGGI